MYMKIWTMSYGMIILRRLCWKMGKSSLYVCGSNMWANRPGADNPCVNQESGTRLLDVRFFDGDLNLLRRKRIQVNPEAFQTLGMYAYGAEQDCLYFASRCVELKTHQCRPYPCWCEGECAFCQGQQRKYIHCGWAFPLCHGAMDRSLLSQHRFKGAGIYYYVNRKGNLCFITSDDETCQWNKARKGACVRLYEVEEMR